MKKNTNKLMLKRETIRSLQVNSSLMVVIPSPEQEAILGGGFTDGWICAVSKGVRVSVKGGSPTPTILIEGAVKIVTSLFEESCQTCVNSCAITQCPAAGNNCTQATIWIPGVTTC